MDPLEDIDPEMLKQIMALGSMDSKQGDIQEQLRMADRIRRKPIPKGGMAGNVYVADPFGAAVGGLEQFKNTRDMKALQAERKANYGQQDTGRNAFLDLLRKKGGMNPSPQVPY